MIYIEYNKKKNSYYERPSDLIFEEVERVEIQNGLPTDNGLFLPLNSSMLFPNENLKPSNELQPTTMNPYLSFDEDLGEKTFYFESLSGGFKHFEVNIKKYDRLYVEPEEDYAYVERHLDNKVILPIFDTLELQNNGLETTFSSIKADFNGKTNHDLPESLQEVRIWEGEVNNQIDLWNCKLLYTGYVESFSIPSIKTINDDYYLEMNILTPMGFTNKRIISEINKQGSITNIINEVLKPLYDDGYTLKLINIKNKNIYVNYDSETINDIMNDLSSKGDFYWYIDNEKNIYIEDLEDIYNKEIKMQLGTYYSKKDGLVSVTPSSYSLDYFNKLIVKNSRTYIEYESETKTLNKGETFEFEYPLDISASGSKRVFGYNEERVKIFLFKLGIDFNIYYNSINNKIEFEIGYGYTYGFSDDEDADNYDIVLIRDNFFSNLITGIKWNKQETITLQYAGDTFLSDDIIEMKNIDEIENQKGKLTKTGVIEKVIDMNDKWFTSDELREYMISLFEINKPSVSEVTIEFDREYDIKIGDLFLIDYKELFINGKYIITSLTNTYFGTEVTQTLTLKNYGLKDNYIDIFKKPIKEESEEDIKKHIEYSF